MIFYIFEAALKNYNVHQFQVFSTFYHHFSFLAQIITNLRAWSPQQKVVTTFEHFERSGSKKRLINSFESDWITYINNKHKCEELKSLNFYSISGWKSPSTPLETPKTRQKARIRTSLGLRQLGYYFLALITQLSSMLRVRVYKNSFL